ncbi:transcriptional regulator MraZ [Bacteroides sp. 214]|uniref:division/cell wall cluster transcriptional repressor MraZ n=1 Tax=Bacteroides sp. 214 TaxID=2302935 RepID=UPI0013D0D526|nr:division/cell wall cluster transcriptional repressor MraZ [Bacteroides sp. 214]NDW12443.1 transcriptional regulator MraZ [Bacteroides sp. 214]
MIRFLGNIEAKTDEKGRVFIPSQFRKQLQAASEETLVLRKDVFQNCLTLYPESVWNEDLNELSSRLSKWDPTHQQIFRQFVSDVEIITPDSNGRILIPKRYLQMAEIQNNVRFIGMNNRIEIWAKEKTEQPFMPPVDFGTALEEIMKNVTVTPVSNEK